MSAHRLDEKGRCCGRKPIPYTGGGMEKRQRFCDRCYRAYHFDTGEQIENWAWKHCEKCGWWPNHKGNEGCACMQDPEAA